MGNDLEFQDSTANSIAARRAKFKTTRQTFAERLVNWGIAKDIDQARLFLIAFVVICFGLIIYINMNTFRSAPIDMSDDLINIEMMDM